MLATANFVWVPPILQFTWEACAGSAFARKFVPVNVMLSVCDGEVLAGEVFGLMLVRLGSGFGGGLMMKAMGLERPLFPAPEAGLRVMMVATPGFATNAAGTVAVTVFPRAAPVLSVGTVVARGLPFHCTTVFRTKPAPWMVSVKSPLPALICEGDRNDNAAPVLF